MEFDKLNIFRIQDIDEMLNKLGSYIPGSGKYRGIADKLTFFSLYWCKSHIINLLGITQSEGNILSILRYDASTKRLLIRHPATEEIHNHKRKPNYITRWIDVRLLLAPVYVDKTTAIKVVLEDINKLQSEISDLNKKLTLRIALLKELNKD